MAVADTVISHNFGSIYSFHLTDGTSLDLEAIFDTKLIVKTKSKENGFLDYKNGLLEVLNKRISKDVIIDSTVQTELGQRRVSNVLYPEPRVSVLVLSPLGESETLNEEYGF